LKKKKSAEIDRLEPSRCTRRLQEAAFPLPALFFFLRFPAPPVSFLRAIFFWCQRWGVLDCCLCLSHTHTHTTHTHTHTHTHKHTHIHTHTTHTHTHAHTHIHTHTFLVHGWLYILSTRVVVCTTSFAVCLVCCVERHNMESVQGLGFRV